MSDIPASATVRPAESKPSWWRALVGYRRVIAVAVLAGLATGAYFGHAEYQVFSLRRSVRGSFEARRYQEAAKPLEKWLALRPTAGEAHYYKAWQALALDRPDEAVLAIEQARKLSFKPDLVSCLSAIYFARARRYDKAEPILEQAFALLLEPREMIAKELAGIYLSTFRLPQAARAVERWRVLAPEDARPYMWRNDIASRSTAGNAILILNYRAALDRDPNLDEARSGLARELSKARRFSEAKEVYLEYLKRRPTDASAFVGLGRDAFQTGDLDGATRAFEAALKVSPSQPDAEKELGLIELRLGRLQQACERFKLLTKNQPFDHEIHYLYAQALGLLGQEARARDEREQAAHLRKERDRMLTLRYNLSRNPNDLDARFQFARWLIEFGQPEEGLRWTTEILRTDPRHAPTHRLLADHYRKNGDAGLANYHMLMSSGP
jgi:tetratricopeptide (TPR) repeat protein